MDSTWLLSRLGCLEQVQVMYVYMQVHGIVKEFSLSLY